MNRPPIPLPYRAVVVDFDRTLLHTDKTLSEYSVRILKAWQDAGARLFAATARPERAIREYCGAIPFDAVTTLNGARTLARDAVYENPICTESVCAVLEQLQQSDGIVLSLETATGLYANRDIPVWSPTVTADLSALPRRTKIYKILASHPEIPADALSVTLPEETYSTVADRNLLQVMSRSATKWNGIRMMLEAYGLNEQQAVFFGDDNDDLEPIRRWGCGVAVSNALDCIREAADYVTGSNDEDGVAAFLAGLYAGQLQ